MQAISIVVNIERITVTFEPIVLDLEEAMSGYDDLYNKRGVELPKDFATRLRDVWQRNEDEIKEIVSHLRYNALAVIPGRVRLPDFHERMTEGYGPTWESLNFKKGGSWDGIKSAKTEEDRIILFHDCLEIYDHPMVASFCGQDLFQVTGLPETELNQRMAKGQFVQGKAEVNGHQHPFDGLAVPDYLAIQAEVLNRTKKHMDAKGITRLLRSFCGRRIPELRWYPNAGQLDVYAVGPGDRGGIVAVRPAAVFF